MPRILILGDDATALGACWRLHAAGHASWKWVRSGVRTTARAQTVRDHQGFIWECAPRPFLSRSVCFASLLDELLPGGFAEHSSSADELEPLAIEAGLGGRRDEPIRFRFPLRGGAGAVWRLVESGLPQDRTLPAGIPRRIDLGRRTVVLADGSSESYDVLLSTLPLDIFLERSSGVPQGLRRRPELARGRSHAVGVGLWGSLPEGLRSRYWLELPGIEAATACISVFSNLSRHHVPRPGRQWSLIVEIREGPGHPADRRGLAFDVADALVEREIVPASSVTANLWHECVEYGTPAGGEGRRDGRNELRDLLAGAGVLACGRFGAWRPEPDDPEALFLAGVEAADRAVSDHVRAASSPLLTGTALEPAPAGFRR